MSIRKHLLTLGLSRSAGKNEIKAVYRELVKKHHPDINPSPNAAEKFMEIHQAYEALLDEGPIEPPIYSNNASREDVHDEWASERATRHAKDALPWYSKYKLKKNATMYNYLSGIVLFVIPIGGYAYYCFIEGYINGNRFHIQLAWLLTFTFGIMFWRLISRFLREWKNRY